NAWLGDLVIDSPWWLSHEKARIRTLLGEMVAFQMANATPVFCLIHGDFHPENILVRGTRITAVDFEHVAMGDPGSDLAYLLSTIQIQYDRYRLQSGCRRSQLDIERLSEVLIGEYGHTHPAVALGSVPLYRARAYLKHLVHTVRMRGTEDPGNVSRWLEEATECLKLHRPHSLYYRPGISLTSGTAQCA